MLAHLGSCPERRSLRGAVLLRYHTEQAVPLAQSGWLFLAREPAEARQAALMPQAEELDTQERIVQAWQTTADPSKQQIKRHQNCENPTTSTDCVLNVFTAGQMHTKSETATLEPPCRWRVQHGQQSLHLNMHYKAQAHRAYRAETLERK